MNPKVLRKSKAFYDEYFRKPGADQLTTHYCPGCGHGVLHKIVAEAIEDFGVQDRTIFISPVGCAVFGYYYFNVGNIQASHGRAPAAATGIKRAHPHSIVISYQGDGDLAAIGTNNIIHAANRGENITVFFINNAIYGMTGGQMAPTTLLGQKTTTTPRGRAFHNEGYPLRVCEMLASLYAPVYIERVAIIDPKHNAKVRKAVRKAIKTQIEGKGFSLVEVLSGCPIGWKMTPVEANRWIEEEMTGYFPLGVYKDRTEEVEPVKVQLVKVKSEDLLEILDIMPKRDEEKLEKPVHNEKYSNPQIKIAGFGGQGILMLGIMFSEVGMRHAYNVSWLPSYGPEMRSGTSHCHVIISNKRIGTPLIAHPDVLIVMNRPSLERFAKDVKPGGLILYDNSLIDIEPKRDDVEILPVPATQLADKLGNTKAANIVMLGAYIGHTNFLSEKIALDTIPDIIKKEKLMVLNRNALKEGIKFVKEKVLSVD